MSAAPITIPHDLPAPAIEVVPAILAEQVQTSVAEAASVVITDAASFEQANALVVRLHQLDKDVAAHGERIKKPLNALLKSVRECLDRAALPVADAKRSVQGKIAAHSRELQRIADEARAKAEAEAKAAREAAERERQRLQAEADAKHAAAVKAAEEEARREAEELAAIMGKPVEVEKVTIAPPPVIVVEPVKPAAPVVVPDAPKSAVSVRMVPTLEIHDPAAVPVSVGGIELRPIDPSAVKRAIAAGLVVPGAAMVDKPVNSMARGVR